MKIKKSLEKKVPRIAQEFKESLSPNDPPYGWKRAVCWQNMDKVAMWLALNFKIGNHSDNP